jgi:tetratricopeptide (TPR) repeat protein
MDDIEKINLLSQHPWLTNLGNKASTRLNQDAKFRNLLVNYVEDITHKVLPKEFNSFIDFGNLLLGFGCNELSRQAYILGIGNGSQGHIANIWNNVGFAYVEEERYEEALNYFKIAIQNKPDYQLAINNLASALINLALKLFSLEGKENIDRAEKLLFESLAVKPNHAWAMLNLGNIWRSRGSVHRAIAWFELALLDNPNYANAHNNLAHVYLTIGKFKKGFRHYEYRWFINDFTSNARFKDQIYWDGKECLNGKTILLHWEQGFGDMIQFCRYTYLLRKAYPEARIILETMPQLVELFGQLASPEGFEQVKGVGDYGYPVNQVISNDRSLQTELNVQFVYPLMSLARIFTHDEASIPAWSAYMARPFASGSWENFVKGIHANGKRLIGINWAGRPSHKNDKHRSIHLNELKTFIEGSESSDVQFVSFQIGSAKQQIVELKLNSRILDVSEKINSFSDTAMMLADMDWFISVDSANLHLAGAMGVKSIGLIAARSDFRWMLDRTDSPWYPSVYLLRQKQKLNWDDLNSRLVTLIVGKA